MNTLETSSAGPYRGLPFARLVIPKGAGRLELRGDASLTGALVRLDTQDAKARVEERDNTVSVVVQRPATLALATGLPWEIELRGGVYQCQLDMSGLRLRTIDLRGGASQLDLALGVPVGLCPVRIDGGASRVEIRRPSGVGIRLHIKDGAHKLAMDAFEFGAVGGPVRWESTEYRNAIDRFDLDVRGGADRLTVGTNER
jgi:hypothetical protein